MPHKKPIRTSSSWLHQLIALIILFLFIPFTNSKSPRTESTFRPEDTSTETSKLARITSFCHPITPPPQITSFGRTALMLAAAQGHVKVVKNLFTNLTTSDITIPDRFGITALMLAEVAQ